VIEWGSFQNNLPKHCAWAEFEFSEIKEELEISF